MDTSVPGDDSVLEQLLQGNRRFVAGICRHPRQDTDRRNVLTGGQKPRAAILACADSRVPPEIIFDQGLGDLFVVRVAGNIINDQILGSLEYAAVHLRVPLIMVLAHSCCGAVTAVASEGELEGHMATLVPAIEPAVVRAGALVGDRVENAARENARMTAEQLNVSEPILVPLVRKEKLRIIAAFYDLATGTVEVLS